MKSNPLLSDTLKWKTYCTKFENNTYWSTFQDAANSKAKLDEKFSQQNEEISDLKYELCQAEDEKDEAVKSAIDQQKEESSMLKTTIVELETQLKELEATSSNENIEAIRDKLASQNIDLASLRVELKRAEGDKQTANKKAHAEIDMERAQVILLLSDCYEHDKSGCGVFEGGVQN